MAWGRVSRAIGQGFYIEAIALQESMIADRLESLLARDGSDVHFGTAGRLATTVQSRWPGQDPDGVLGRVRQWSDQRAAAIHQMVKYGDGHDATWRERSAEAHAVAEVGVDLVKDVDALVRNLKRSLTS